MIRVLVAAGKNSRNVVAEIDESSDRQGYVFFVIHLLVCKRKFKITQVVQFNFII